MLAFLRLSKVVLFFDMVSDGHPPNSPLLEYPDFSFAAQRVRCGTKPTTGTCGVQVLGGFFPLMNRDADIALVVKALERLYDYLIYPPATDSSYRLHPIISFTGGPGIGK